MSLPMCVRVLLSMSICLAWCTTNIKQVCSAPFAAGGTWSLIAGADTFPGANAGGQLSGEVVSLSDAQSIAAANGWHFVYCNAVSNPHTPSAAGGMVYYREHLVSDLVSNKFEHETCDLWVYTGWTSYVGYGQGAQQDDVAPLSGQWGLSSWSGVEVALANQFPGFCYCGHGLSLNGGASGFAATGGRPYYRNISWTPTQLYQTMMPSAPVGAGLPGWQCIMFINLFNNPSNTLAPYDITSADDTTNGWVWYGGYDIPAQQFNTQNGRGDNSSFEDATYKAVSNSWKGLVQGNTSLFYFKNAPGSASTSIQTLFANKKNCSTCNLYLNQVTVTLTTEPPTTPAPPTLTPPTDVPTTISPTTPKPPGPFPAGGTWSLITGADTFAGQNAGGSYSGRVVSLSEAQSTGASNGWHFVYCNAASNPHTPNADRGTVYYRAQLASDLVAGKFNHSVCDLWIYTGWVSYVGWHQGAAPDDVAPYSGVWGLSAWTGLEVATANNFPGFCYCAHGLSLNGGASGFAATGGRPYYRAASWTPTRLYQTMMPSAPVGQGLPGWQCVMFINTFKENTLTLAPYDITSPDRTTGGFVWYGGYDIADTPTQIFDRQNGHGDDGLIDAALYKAVSRGWDGIVEGGDTLFYFKHPPNAPSGSASVQTLFANKKNCSTCNLYLHQVQVNITAPPPTTTLPPTTQSPPTPTNEPPVTGPPTPTPRPAEPHAGGSWSLIARVDTFPGENAGGDLSGQVVSLATAQSVAAANGYHFIYCNAASDPHTPSANGGMVYYRSHAVKDLVANKIPHDGCDLWVYTGWISYVAYGQGGAQDDVAPSGQQGLSAWSSLELALVHEHPGFCYCGYGLDLNGGSSGFAATGGRPFYRNSTSWTPTRLYQTMAPSAPVGHGLPGWQCIMFINTFRPYDITSADTPPTTNGFVWYGGYDIQGFEQQNGRGDLSTLDDATYKAWSNHWFGLVRGGDSLFYFKHAPEPTNSQTWMTLFNNKKNCSECNMYLNQVPVSLTTQPPTTPPPATETPPTDVPTTIAPTTPKPAPFPAGGTWSLIAGADTFAGQNAGGDLSGQVVSLAEAQSIAASKGYHFVYCNAASDPHTPSANGGTVWYRSQPVNELVAGKFPHAVCDLWVYTGWISYVGWHQGAEQDDVAPISGQWDLSAWTGLEVALANSLPGLCYCGHGLSLNGGASGFAATGGRPFYRNSSWTPTRLYQTMVQSASVGPGLPGWQCIMFINTLAPYDMTTSPDDTRRGFVWYGAHNIPLQLDQQNGKGDDGSIDDAYAKAHAKGWSGVVEGEDTKFYFKHAPTATVQTLFANKQNCSTCNLYINQVPPTSAPTAPINPATDSSNGPNGPLIGTALGLTALAIIIVIAVFYCYRRRQQNKKQQADLFDDDTASAEAGDGSNPAAASRKKGNRVELNNYLLLNGNNPAP